MHERYFIAASLVSPTGGSAQSVDLASLHEAPPGTQQAHSAHLLTVAHKSAHCSYTGINMHQHCTLQTTHVFIHTHHSTPHPRTRCAYRPHSCAHAGNTEAAASVHRNTCARTGPDTPHARSPGQAP